MSNEPTPPTDEELSRWVITGATNRPTLAVRLERCIGEIRRIRGGGDMAEPSKGAPSCRRCSVQMVEGQALVPTYVGQPDFPGDTGNERGCTMTPGPGRLAAVWKCPACGHSIKA